MMKKRKSLFFQICMIFAMLAVSAALCGAEVQAEETTPRATFTNESSDTPDLYVTKQVTTADEAYPAPADSTFSFILKLSDRLASGVVYQVFDAQGDEVFLYEDGPSTEDRPNKLQYRTDSNGDFTLLGGQTAKFAYVGTGKSYEIVENETENYEQTSPAGGMTAGTVEASGTSVTFVNEYQPEIPVVPGSKETTTLTVRKKVSFPEGFAMPDTPDFAFTVMIEGEPWANKEYTVYNDQTGLVIETKQTGADGSFTMKADQRVSFAEVPVGVDYRVEEQLSGEWRVSGDAGREGATKAPVTALTYTNLLASFAVSKELQDNTTGTDAFSFTLQDAAGKVWPDASYYLYAASGVRVDEETHKTDAKGAFTLQAGQCALFVGIPTGTGYQVSETAKSGYTQKMPASTEGYTGKTVIDAVERLRFVNEKITEGALTVTKVVDNASGEPVPKDDHFTFVLQKKDGDTYQPVAQAVYEIRSGSGTKTYRTGADGSFTLQQNQSAVFTRLSRTGTYKVQETELGINYALGSLTRNGEAVEGAVDALEGKLSDALAFSFTNIYQPPAFTIQLKKTDSGGDALAGAEMTLYTDEACTEEVESVTSTADGTVAYTSSLDPGVYYIKETKAPAGYSLLSNPIKVTLERKEGIPSLSVNDEPCGTDASEAMYMESTKDASIAHITVKNHKAFQIPLAGGSGILLSTVLLLGGIALLALFWRKKIRQEV